MKKSVLLLAAAAMTLTACTNTEEIESGSSQATGQIGFASHVNKNTRALDNANLEKFYVSAAYTTAANTANPVQILNLETVTKEGSVWNYANTRYWINGATYSFYAYSKENETSTNARFDNATAKFSLHNYKVDADAANQKDLVFASAENILGKETGNDKVAFNFKHILSKACFNFISDFPEGYTIDVTNVQIRNFRDQGTFDDATGTFAWKDVNRSYADNDADWVTLSLPFAENVKHEGMVNKNEAITGEFYVLPFNYTQANVRLRFTLTVKNQNGETVSTSVRRTDFKPVWAQGHAYKYNVTLTGAAAGLEKIEFTVDENAGVEGWETGTDNVEFTFGSEV